MNIFLRISLILLVALIFTSCGPKPNVPGHEQVSVKKQELIMTRFQDIQSGQVRPNYDHFGPGEVPCVYLNGFGGQAATIKIYNVSTGALIATRTTSISKNMNHYWQLSDLPSGSYRADVSVGEVKQDSKLFNVSE